VNYIDTYHRTGLYKLPLPAIIGREAAGIVVAVGAEVHKDQFAVNDRVVFMGSNTYAEYVAVDAAIAVKVPAAVSLKDAAGLWLQGLTAQYLTHSTYPIQSGDFVLIHAAAGGTGSMVVQFAKSRGAKVIATAGTPEKVELVKKLGADHVILYTKQNFREEVMKITNNAGVAAAYDGVGKATWEDSLKCLRPLGYLVLFGNASGAVPPVDPLLLQAQGSVFLTRPSLHHYVSTPEALHHRAKQVWHAVETKLVTIRVGAEFPLEKAADAHKLLESRESTGKIVLVVNPKLQ